MRHHHARLALGFAASLMLLHCSGEVIDFRSRDAGAIGGDGTCAPTNRGEPLDGLPCTGSELRSTDCQLCQCHEGSLKCSEYICRDRQCPARPPAPGGACESAGCSCEYPNACGTPHVARCVQRQYRAEWAVEYAQCAPECPSALPENGSGCWDQYARCDYGSRDGGAPRHASCLGGTAGSGNDHVAGRWMVFDESTEPGAGVCPDTQPLAGTACSDKELECFYQDECGAVDRVQCSDEWGGQWSVKREFECWSGCPAQQPHTGDACETPLDVGPGCSYAHGTSCLTTCFCKSDHRYACFAFCSEVAGDYSEQLGSGYSPPGSVPWSQCAQHAWCPEISSTCGGPDHECACTAQGWECH